MRQNHLPLPAPESEPGWVGVLLLACLALLVLVKAVAYPRVLRIAQSTFRTQVLQQLEREEGNIFRPYAVALNLLFLLNVAFLLYKYNENSPFVFKETSGGLQYLFFLGLSAGLLIFKLIFNRILILLTGARKLLGEYTVSSTLINQTFGLFLFPCLMLAEFSRVIPDIFLWAALLILLLSILLKWYRGLVICLGEQGLGFLQIFSYFCALEILPVLVLVKYVVETH